MKISVFAHTANPQTDRPMVRKSRAYVLQLLAEAAAGIVDGLTPETTRAVQLYAPINRMDPRTIVEESIGWNMPKFLQQSGLNRGRAGQFPIGYPIPYAFEGHLKSPRVDEINFIPKTA